MKLEYINADVSDIEAIFSLSKKLIDTYEDIGAIDYDKVIRWLRRKIEGHIGEYVRVRLDGQTAGYYRFCPSEERMELDDLYVLPEFRNRGIGTQIIRKCCAETELPVFLYVFSGNRRAMALYERMGFHIIERAGSTRYIMQREQKKP